MIDYILMTITMVLVLWLMNRFKLLPLAKAALDITSEANAVLFNSSLGDLEKEQHSRQMAKKLMAQLGRVLLAASAVFLLPLLPLYTLSLFKLVNLDQLFATMMTLPALVLFTVVGVLWWWVSSRFGEQSTANKSDFEDDYSFVDKALHNLAFGTSKIQLTMAKQESEKHQAALKPLRVERPVFITGLPRSGTTILLDVLSKSGQFSYHRYQDMPFVLTPLVWDKFSKWFVKTADGQGELKERAHQDGIKINQQSPEAFEEMLWKAHWPQAYNDSAIEPWSETANLEFDQFFTEHIKKLLLRDNRPRYISKNNLNITRVPYLKRLFPDSLVLVPFREPLQHALSLLKQHRNFGAMHQNNHFSRAYMAGVGHFDFGANLKPVNFNGWARRCSFSPDTVDFWLAYWIETYQYLLDVVAGGHSGGHGGVEGVLFVGFEALCKEPESSFNVLAGQLAIEPQTLVKSVSQIRVARAHPVERDSLDGHNLARAEAVYQRLLERAVNGYSWSSSDSLSAMT